VKKEWRRNMHKIKFTLKMLVVIFAILIISNPAMADEKTETYIQQGHSSYVTSIDFSPDGKYIISGSDDKTLKLWDISSGREIRTYK
jgi:WD40 repeat protein